MKPLPQPLARAREGRVLAGVCAGIARHRAMPVGTIRAAFAVLSLAGGLGLLVYLACWLIIPAEGDSGEAGPRAIVVLAMGCAGCLALATIAVLAAGATVFGFGWVILAIAAVSLVCALAAWPRAGPGWVLLPVAALALPSMAVAAAQLSLAPTLGSISAAPATVKDLPADGYRAGVGTMFIDLRRFAFPARGDVSLNVHGGVRRTIVALPHDRCVPVTIDYRSTSFLQHAANEITGRWAFHGLVAFGDRFGEGIDDPFGGERAGLSTEGAHPGPSHLTIHFRSQGGSLYVRDYPDNVQPQQQPDWPGYQSFVESRPDTTGLSKRESRRELGAWRVRHRREVRSERQIKRLMPGPCGSGATS
jgi:phage shock protein PspC (stress-responsive transcriptional regulator)